MSEVSLPTDLHNDLALTMCPRLACSMAFVSLSLPSTLPSSLPSMITPRMRCYNHLPPLAEKSISRFFIMGKHLQGVCVDGSLFRFAFLAPHGLEATITSILLPTRTFLSKGMLSSLPNSGQRLTKLSLKCRAVFHKISS